MADSYASPMRASAPSGSPSGYTDPKQVDRLLKSSSPDVVAEAGRSYQKLAAAHEKIAGELLTLRNDLHAAWGGQAAAAAQSALREIWASATTVHRTANEFGAAVERHGSESLAWYKNNKPPSKDLAEAQSWMTGANERISQAWLAMPSEISTTLPHGSRIDGHGPPVSSGLNGGGPGPAGKSAGGTEAPGGGGSMPPIGGGGYGSSSPLGGGGGTMPGSSGSGADLAGAPPIGPGGTGLGGGLGVLPGGSGLSGGGGSFPLGGTSPNGSSMPGMGSPLAPGGLGGIQPGAGNGFQSESRLTSRGLGAAAAEETGAQASAARNVGVAGPVAGSGSGAEDKERTRSTWLAEGPDTWTAGLEATPPVIGGEHEKEPEGHTLQPPIEIDLSSDDDELTELLNELAGEQNDEDPWAEIAALRARLQQLERQADLDPGEANGGVGGPNWVTGEAR